MSIDRRQFLDACSAAGLSGLFPGALYAQVAEEGDDEAPITTEHVATAESIAGLAFTEEERELLVENLNETLEQYETLRTHALPNARAPATIFDPRRGGAEIPEVSPSDDGAEVLLPSIDRPSADQDLAFASISELAHLLRARKVTSVELTELALRRLRRYDDRLHAVISYTEDRALTAARQADDELDAGTWRGPLHGVPYGAKDLLAVAGTPTTWGAAPYKDQTIDETATVVKRLDEAGAVLVAKLALGALAWGDVWYDATTKNPWNLDQGSSGSSAGPAAAVSAGCVPFAIGSETLGSIVSPSTRCGVTGHRPTFGAVGRGGAMALSWTMDKLGPIARSALDCAHVYDAIRGADPDDPASVDVPFPFEAERSAASLRVGYLHEAFEEDYGNQAADQTTLEVLRGLGVDLEPVSWNADVPVGALLNTLDVEAAAAFDELTRSGGVDDLVRQGENTWPNVFRSARFVPAVEHVQMDRLRVDLMEQAHAVMQDLDVLVSPSFGGGTLSITNLTGHPCVCLPNALRPVDEGPDERREPGSVSFVAPLYKDQNALTLAHAVQKETEVHNRRPPIR
ncbi:amidase [Salinibacter altiplanensis]|uniref:amidase n=1 Tax=Salinibacter altiplanensis TaxID=1803181 RepID=UPI000C9EF1AD|nr:amidase [Salinibacter altiplanensis]